MTTLTTGEVIHYDRDGLEAAVEQSKTRFIPQPVEHLHYLPPVGRVVELRLVEHEGHAYVAFREEPLAAGIAEDLALAPHSDADDADEPHQLTVTLSTEPRNFGESEFAKIRESSPISIGEIALHAELPPIVWSFVIGAGGLVAAKAFLTEFFKELGHESAHSFVEWLRTVARRARQGEREQMAEFRFPLDNGG